MEYIKLTQWEYMVTECIKLYFQIEKLNSHDSNNNLEKGAHDIIHAYTPAFEKTMNSPKETRMFCKPDCKSSNIHHNY